MTDREDDVVLKLLHTADWHLGLPFATFDDEGRKKLRRARMDVLDEIFGVAEREAVDAVLCAGDLFDSTTPDQMLCDAIADKLRRLDWSGRRRVFLLPGNHDPLVPQSPWSEDHKFRRSLPDFVRVIDRPNFEADLGEGAVLYASPCCSKASSADQAMALPSRAPGDDRIRVGMVHGMTFDLPGHEAIFPIAADAAALRGLDYLALGDTHGFRNVASEGQPPMVYPGAPEQTKFGERAAGHVALVLIKRSRKVRLEKRPVARWTWRQEHVTDIEQLRRLQAEDLASVSLHLTVSGAFEPATHEEANQILRKMQGTDFESGSVGAMRLDRVQMHLDARNLEQLLADLPEEVRKAAQLLEAKRAAAGDRESAVVERALLQLYRLARGATA